MGRASITYPRDLLALQLAHVGDFFLDHSHLMRDRVTRVLPHWTCDVPGYGFVEGMYAFGLEQAGDCAQAEAHARVAVGINRQDRWAVHAIAHVLEMHCRAQEGVTFLAEGVDGWAPNSLFAYHLWWHMALFHSDADDAPAALQLFDKKISAAGFGQALELVDGASLLWRLSLLGHNVGDSWTDLDHNRSRLNFPDCSIVRIKHSLKLAKRYRFQIAATRLLHRVDGHCVRNQWFKRQRLLSGNAGQHDAERVRQGNPIAANTTVASSLMCSSIRARTTALADMV